MNRLRGEYLKKAYEKYSDEIVRYLSSRMRGRQGEVSDIMQTAFMKLAAKTASEEVTETRGFLYRTAKNLMIDNGRRKLTRDRYVKNILIEEPQSCAQHYCLTEQTVLQRERLRLLEGVIKTLPARRRRVFILNRIHGLSYAEIAKEVNLTTEGVRKHVSRALADCEAALQNIYCDDNFVDQDGPEGNND